MLDLIVFKVIGVDLCVNKTSHSGFCRYIVYDLLDYDFMSLCTKTSTMCYPNRMAVIWSHIRTLLIALLGHKQLSAKVSYAESDKAVELYLCT